MEKIPAIIVAVLEGNFKKVAFLIKGGCALEKQWGDLHSTALMLASEKGDVEIVSALIKAGADIEARNYVGWTALTYAARSGQDKIVSMLLAAGANVNESDVQGSTALMFAAQEGHIKVVEALYLGHAKVNIVDNFIGDTALAMANDSGHQEIVDFLRMRGGK